MDPPPPLALASPMPVAPRTASLTKLLRMIRLATCHEGTQALIVTAVGLLISYQASQRATRMALRQRAQERLLALAIEHHRSPSSRVQSTGDLKSMADDPAEKDAQIRRTQSLQSLQVLREEAAATDLSSSSDGAPKRMTRSTPALRRPGERVLYALAEEHELCEECLSRCASHQSLTQLADEEVESGCIHAERDVAASTTAAAKATKLLGALDVASTPPQSTVMSAELVELGAETAVVAPATPAPSRPPSLAASLLASRLAPPPAGVRCAPGHRCELCCAARSSWTTIVRRVLGAAGATWLGYLLWLRFVATKETARRHLMTMVRVLGEKVFAYRFEGAEAIPAHGPAVLCIYHGFIPLDIYFLHEWIARTTGRTPTTLAADFVFKIPLFGYFCRLCGGAPAGRKVALRALELGGLVLVAPGGVREAITTSAEDYAPRWYGKKGFAEIARRAQAPIVPLFTQNMREVFLVLGGSIPLVQRLYRLTKLPFTPFFGPIPVPLTTVAGAPIAHDERRSAADTAEVVRLALAALMRHRSAAVAAA